MKKRNLKRTKVNMKRVTYSLALIVVLVLGLMIVMGNNKTSSFVETKYKTFHVSSGETLWEIAEIELANNDYYANKDVRYIVKDIKDLNNLTTSNLYSGQELTIPTI